MIYFSQSWEVKKTTKITKTLTWYLDCESALWNFTAKIQKSFPQRFRWCSCKFAALGKAAWYKSDFCVRCASCIIENTFLKFCWNFTNATEYNQTQANYNQYHLNDNSWRTMSLSSKQTQTLVSLLSFFSSVFPDKRPREEKLV